VPNRDRRRQQHCAQEHGRPVRVAQVRQNLPHEREEVVQPDADPEELAQLGRDHDQRDPVDIAEQHRLAEEVGHEPQPQHARQEEHATHRQRQRGGQGRVEGRVDLPSDDRQRGNRHRGERRER
jgi:hypothetical protein